MAMEREERGDAMVGRATRSKIQGVALLMLSLVGCARASGQGIASPRPQRDLIIRHVRPGQVIPGLEFWSQGKYTHVRSTIVNSSSTLIPGVPIQNPDAPVVVLSCSMKLAKPFGSANNSTTDYLTVLNRTNKTLSLVRVLSVYLDSGIGEEFIQNLKPHEMRSSVLVDNETGPGALNARAIRNFNMPKPPFMLCGAGPALASDGTAYEFEPPFPRVLGENLEHPF